MECALARDLRQPYQTRLGIGNIELCDRPVYLGVADRTVVEVESQLREETTSDGCVQLWASVSTSGVAVQRDLLLTLAM